MKFTLPTLGIGCAPLGNLFGSVTDEQAIETIDAAWETGIRFFDTAPLYGFGESERRLGLALRDRPRDEVVIATKVGRVLADGQASQAEQHPFVDVPAVRPVFDFSRDGVLRSFESSLERLRTDRIDLLHVHDPDDHMDQAIAEAFPAIAELRDQGVVGAIGCGMNVASLLARVVAEAPVDAVLIAGRYTLLEQPALDELFPACEANGVKVIAAGVFNSGVLAGADTYNYGAVTEVVRQRVDALRALCERHDVALTAAALQFPSRHPVVQSLLFGARNGEEVRRNVGDLELTIPEDFWEELDQLG